jgi:hypothetical protein
MAEKPAPQKYTVIHLKPFGYRAGQYLPAMKRIKTSDLRAYLDKHALDATHVFEGWPKLEGETNHG